MQFFTIDIRKNESNYLAHFIQSFTSQQTDSFSHSSTRATDLMIYSTYHDSSVKSTGLALGSLFFFDLQSELLHYQTKR